MRELRRRHKTRLAAHVRGSPCSPVPRKGSDDGTDVVVLNECSEWMGEPREDGHLQKPEEAPVLFFDFDPVTAWIAVLPMKVLVVWIEGMDSGVTATEGTIAVPDSVRHGAGGVWWGL